MLDMNDSKWSLQWKLLGIIESKWTNDKIEKILNHTF